MKKLTHTGKETCLVSPNWLEVKLGQESNSPNPPPGLCLYSIMHLLFSLLS